MKIGLLISLFVFVNGLAAQPCAKVVNVHGHSVDLSCPDGPPFFSVGTLYESDREGDWSGGQGHNCTWPKNAYAYIQNRDTDGICHVVTGTEASNFGTDFHGVCLGTYYVAGNTSHKNTGNVGWGPGDGFACSELGDDCFGPPGSSSKICSQANEGACYAIVTGNCHIHIMQGGDSIVCPTAGTGN